MISIVAIVVLLLLAGFPPPYLTRGHRALAIACFLCFLPMLVLGGDLSRAPTEATDGAGSVVAPLFLAPSLIGFLAGVSARLVALHYEETRVFGPVGIRAGAATLMIATAVIFVPLKILLG